MAEPEKTDAAKEPAQIKMNVLAQFIRDMSFENILAQTGQGGDNQPNIQVQVNLDGKKRELDNQFEVAIKLQIDAKSQDNKNQMFIMEIDYVGIFHVENVPEEQMHAFLLIECPRMLFPFLRRVVSDVTRDGGFPPLNLETIDFMALYRQEMLRRQAEAEVGKAKS